MHKIQLHNMLQTHAWTPGPGLLESKVFHIGILEFCISHFWKGIGCLRVEQRITKSIQERNGIHGRAFHMKKIHSEPRESIPSPCLLRWSVESAIFFCSSHLPPANGSHCTESGRRRCRRCPCYRQCSSQASALSSAIAARLVKL